MDALTQLIASALSYKPVITTNIPSGNSPASPSLNNNNASNASSLGERGALDMQVEFLETLEKLSQSNYPEIRYQFDPFSIQYIDLLFPQFDINTIIYYIVGTRVCKLYIKYYKHLDKYSLADGPWYSLS